MFLNLSAYQFKPLSGLDDLKIELKTKAKALNIKGTILLAPEGINMNLSGARFDLLAMKTYIIERLELHDMPLKWSESERDPFARLKIKLKKEIITFRQDDIDPIQKTVEHMPPEQLKQWYDEGKEFYILDTRNDYEIEVGQFKNAKSYDIENFTELTDAVKADLENYDTSKPMVTYCTGGVRCEKAGPAIEALGFKEVYQLDGGILNYFEKCGGEHWQGDCFVFDDRHALTPELKEVQD